MEKALAVARKLGELAQIQRGDLVHPLGVAGPADMTGVGADQLIVYRGREEVRHYVEDWLATFEGVRLDLEDTTEVADRVVTVVRGHGRGRASGLALDNRFCQVWTVRGGAAVGMAEYATREEGLAGLRS